MISRLIDAVGLSHHRVFSNGFRAFVRPVCAAAHGKAAPGIQSTDHLDWVTGQSACRTNPIACGAPIAATKNIVVDLTPLRPGGENGGAKLVATELTRELSQLARDWQFFVLTDSSSHEELGWLEDENLDRVQATNDTAFRKRGSLLKRALRKGLKESHVTRLRSLITRFRRKETLPKSIREAGIDLLFCPFGEIRFDIGSSPAVATIHDVQQMFYPQFFDVKELARRSQMLCSTAKRARIVCDSGFVRDTLVEKLNVPSERIEVVPLSLRATNQPPSELEQRGLLESFGLETDRFLFYPANFWQHKNHSVLLTAYGMFRSQHAQSDLKLVLSGEPLSFGSEIRECACRMGLSQSVLFPGYVSDAEIATLQRNCRALIFPSLYEGFGLPVFEAMRIGKPILCSNSTSLPELAGDAALYFDPRQPREILAAIERLESDASIAPELVERGRLQMESLGDTEQMVRSYQKIFETILSR